ncbi:DUF4011 domain-containing protein [Ornithinimicrobium ciconiae]|uniref:DUF4011 domain-containing protein n=1 Tax=Ornithinimicrobium ciconiae TaxID=2594265 RepID=A0A516GE58_9MICO|nr:DUF4011 domain-containing protein [Ornithinimicrobium ciconiae]QDO89817.1 DUF4011 domain-containing protein [Ornithinimicrobium ciconiae]
MSHDADAPANRVDAASLDVVTPAVDRWRAELSEVGGRNTLMWHRDLPTGTIDLTVAHPGGVAKLLAGHNTLLSELVRESVALAEARRRVTAIRAKSLELQREYGMSTLFLGVGMASWRLPRAPIPPRAPVLLRGARIRPTDASRRDYVLRLDSDVLFNPALEHYLRGEVGIELDGHDLARTSVGRQGFDPRPTYDRLEDLCSHIEGFGIGPQLVLSTYPLAKLPLVAELAGPVEHLVDRPLVVSLATGVQDVESAQAADEAVPGDRSVTVLEADASQRQVLRLLDRGRSLVLDAAPGTGRTQTIVNAVAQAAGEGRSSLVVAERRRALDEVQERLRDIGLGDLLLDVRETPAAARRVAAELIEALDRHQGSATAEADQGLPVAAPEPAEGATDPLAVLRAHEKHLHGPHEPWEVTLAQTQDVLTRLAGLSHPPTSHVRLEPEVLATLTPETMGQVRDALVRAVAAGAWKGRAEDPWFGSQITTAQDAERAAEVVADLVSGTLTQARERVVALATSVGLPAPLNVQQWSRTFDLLRRVRDTLDVFTAEVYEAPLGELVQATTKHPKGSPDKLSAMTRSRLRRQARSLLRPGAPPPDLGDRLTHARDERSEWESLAGRAARPAAPRGWEDAAEEYAGIHRDLTWLGEVLRTTPQGQDLETTHLDLLLERLIRLDAQSDRLPVVAEVHGDLQPLRDRGLGRLVDDLAHRRVAEQHVEAEADLVFWASVHDQIATREGMATSADLRAALAELDSQEQARTRSARDTVLTVTRQRLDAALAAHPAQEQALRDLVDAGPPLRMIDLLAAAPDLVRSLRPCWVASPLTVPATIPVDIVFDLLVIDEAQRIPVAHAVPSLARADVVLLVGDSDGLTGLPFVGVVDEHAAPVGAVSESVFAASSKVLPVRHLDNHYRSMDQRMLPRRTVHTPHGFPGVLLSSGISVVEAPGTEARVAAVVDLIVDHARRGPSLSLGVVVADDDMVIEVEQVLRARIAEESDLIGSFREDVAEPFLLSTPHRAAGDVRDRMILVLGGEDDLSDAAAIAVLSSARRSVVIVQGDPPAGSQDAGVLQEAVLAAAAPPDQATEGTGESALLTDLATRLAAEDLTVRIGYGSGPHRIELVVDDPDMPGRPLLAVDTDARPDPHGPDADRIRTRSVHLRALGWTPVRVWTTDVFRDPAQEVARIVAAARKASAERHR